MDWQSDLETLAGLRERLDPAVDLMIDGNENFTVKTALAVAGRLAELGIGWFEEPVLQESPEAMDAMAARSPVPLACGEHLFGLAEFEEAVGRKWATFLQPDASTCGGLAEGMRIAAAGHRAGVQVVPHSAAGPVALAAGLHLARGLADDRPARVPVPAGRVLGHDRPKAARWSPTGWSTRALTPPDVPGLGIEIDFEAVKSRPYQAPAPRTGPSPRYAGNV